ncbi:hypothetical protein SASPL_107595 [Salvia splendens]|uniref:Endoglucanase n=1 Tax=Salvia splendens TaxID=180675 RepID=A0A8X8YH48_SALSN|nr:hypothetical protein SASPL_107595 [Salvia splendens]
MAFSTTMMAWGVIEYGKSMGPELAHAAEAVRWSTEYFLKATASPGVVFAQVGDPNCWQRPEDMDTPRTVYAVTQNAPGSEVSAEIAAALAASPRLWFSKLSEIRLTLKYLSLQTNIEALTMIVLLEELALFIVIIVAIRYDELLWGAAWLYKASKKSIYLNYVMQNIINFKPQIEAGISEFGWDAKHAGINVLVSKLVGYILGSNPLSMSYMVGYGSKFPRRIHHRASSLPSVAQHPDHIACKDGTPYFMSADANPNELTGAVVGGPNVDDSFADDRVDSTKSEPATYINAPLLGLLAYFKSRSSP